jgi:DNA-binding MurR/RpiR family transcriptional regulator
MQGHSPLYDELKPTSENALCVRYYKDQDKEIRRLAEKYGVSNARILRFLVRVALTQKVL